MRIRFYIDLYVADPEPGVFVITSYELKRQAVAHLSQPAQKEGQAMKQRNYPKGWDEERVRQVLHH